MKKPYLVSDAGLNHNGDYKRACDSVFQAKQCGFDAIKFQLYDVERLTEDAETRKLLEAGKFDPKWLPGLRDLCDDLKIDLAVTPFYPEAVDIIKPYVDFIKIGSYEIAYYDLIAQIKKTGKLVIASTGMATQGEELQLLNSTNLHCLLYCVSKYPCDIEDVDMRHIKNMREQKFCKHVGYSDHSHDPNVIWAALIAGAEYIELHFDVDGKGLEYPMGHVWSSFECFELIHDIRSAFQCFEPTNFVPDYSKRTNQNGRRL